MKGYQVTAWSFSAEVPWTFVVRTFDFGRDGRVFASFDGGQGDGGQVLMLVDRCFSAAMTQGRRWGQCVFVGSQGEMYVATGYWTAENS